jgi:hypothetical protein
VQTFSVTDPSTIDKEADMLSIQSVIQNWKRLESLHICWISFSHSM